MTELNWPTWADGLSVDAIRELYEAAVSVLAAEPKDFLDSARRERLRQACDVFTEDLRD